MRTLDGAVHEFSAVLGQDPWMEFRISISTEPAQRSVELHCREGIARLGGAYDDCVEVMRFAPGGAALRERRPIATEPPLRRELRALLAHLRGGPPPRSSAAEGARMVTVLQLRALAARLVAGAHPGEAAPQAQASCNNTVRHRVAYSPTRRGSCDALLVMRVLAV